jgi:hypothetical protein
MICLAEELRAAIAGPLSHLRKAAEEHDRGCNDPEPGKDPSSHGLVPRSLAGNSDAASAFDVRPSLPEIARKLRAARGSSGSIFSSAVSG